MHPTQVTIDDASPVRSVSFTAEFYPKDAPDADLLTAFQESQPVELWGCAWKITEWQMSHEGLVTFSAISNGEVPYAVKEWLYEEAEATFWFGEPAAA